MSQPGQQQSTFRSGLLNMGPVLFGGVSGPYLFYGRIESMGTAPAKADG